MKKNFSEGSQGGCYAREFILEAHTFMLELFNDRLNQRFRHGINSITRKLNINVVCAKEACYSLQNSHFR